MTDKITFKPSTRFSSLVLMLVLACLSPFSSRAVDAAARETAVIYTQPCSARWSMLSSQTNRPGEPGFQVRLNYAAGPKDTSATEGVLPVGLSVRLASSSSGDDASELSVQLTGSELSRSVEKSLTLMVPERGTVTAWQLVATTGDKEDQPRVYGFDSTAVTSGGLQPPTRIAACTASFHSRQVITEETLVRIRHAATGRYLVMTPKSGWEAATLGYSKEYRFRLNGVGVAGSSVRIEAETHVYGGFKFAYSSFLGRVYFDRLKPTSEAQLWTLSNPYPSDKDSVTITNVRWPSASLNSRNENSIARVFCVNSASPDKWILEIA